MAEYYQLDVYKASYKLLTLIFLHTQNLNKEYKYTFGEKIKKKAFKILIHIYKANSKQNKTKQLSKAKENLEYIRLSIRLLYDLKVFNDKKVALLNLQIEDVSKQLSGWYNFEVKKE